MKYLWTALTDIGGRKTNQDSLLVKRAICNDRQILLTVLCDGMGGFQKGEVASASLIRAFSRWFESEFREMTESGFQEQPMLLSLDSLIRTMNRKIMEYGRNQGIKLGTTLTAMIFVDETYYIAHVGDSRVYELTDRTYQLTKDQTLVQREVDQKILTPEQALNDPRRSILLQCVGAAEEIEPVYVKGTICKDAVYILCCDGFRHVINTREIYQILNPEEIISEEVLEQRCRQLIDLNKARGEQDNISVIAIRTW
jgi:serine/threonine protein phosphatase PrpC